MRSIIIVLIFTAVTLTLGAQTRLSSETKRHFSQIETGLKGVEPTYEWILQNIPQLPVYLVHGEYCLSVVARVDHTFSSRSLQNQCVIGARVEDIVTLKIPLTEIRSELSFPGVEYMETAGRIQPLNNKLAGDVRADSVWKGLDLPQGYTGKGVLIGITDWGFDYGHPMFMDTAMTYSRIRAAWDQFKIMGTPPAGMNYGAEYNTPAALSNALCDTAGAYYDYATHGSHVAGIAAGSGAGTKYRGVAFEAEYLFNSLQLDEGSAIDAFSWMKSVADADQKRLVINMSWGLYYMGTMDGTSLLSQVIHTMSSQGVVFVTSAGNNGDVNLHIKKDFNQDSIRTRIGFYGYNLHPAMWGQSISMWGEQGHPFSAKLEIYDASNLLVSGSPVFNTQLHAGYHDTILVIGSDTLWYNCTIDASHPLNARPQMRLRVKNTHTSYRVVLVSFAPSGRVHYWNVVELSNGVGNWGLPFYAFGNNGVVGNPDYSLGEPACTESAITVAAHISETILTSGTAIPGSRSSFSSRGPTYDERMKPDVSAPGSNVISSINSYTSETYTPVITVPFNGRTYGFAAFSGTSMSGPATAGVVALMLEANPALSPLQVRQILKATARQDAKTGVISPPGSTSWGMGKVTAIDAVKMALNTINLNEPHGLMALTLYPNPASDHLVLQFDSPPTIPTDYMILSQHGQVIRSGILTESATIDIASWSQGVYFLKVFAQSNTTTLKFVKL